MKKGKSLIQGVATSNTFWPFLKTICLVGKGLTSKQKIPSTSTLSMESIRGLCFCLILGAPRTDNMKCNVDYGFNLFQDTKLSLIETQMLRGRKNRKGLSNDRTISDPNENRRMTAVAVPDHSLGNSILSGENTSGPVYTMQKYVGGDGYLSKHI